MTQPAPHISLNGSRLLRYLTDLAVSDVQLNHKDFALKLGQLIGFSDSFTLAEKLDLISKQEPTSYDASSSVVKQFMATRKGLIEHLLKSELPPSNKDTLKVEIKKEAETADPITLDFAPYLRFYTARQRDLELKIQPLHNKVRNGLKDTSMLLAQLCALDSAMSEVLNGYQRKCLGVIPTLLQQRFDYLLQEYAQEHANRAEQVELYAADITAQASNKQSSPEPSSQSNLAIDHKQGNAQVAASESQTDNPGDWISTFQRSFQKETQGLLLAELELRLLPTLGLIEALNESKEVEKVYD